jgi:hypothetical protein
MPYDLPINSLEKQWMPFTDNRGFKSDPRLITEAMDHQAYFVRQQVTAIQR